MRRKPKYGSKTEVLFPEDVEWIDAIGERSLSLARQKSLPLDYDGSGARTVFISRPMKRSVELGNPESWACPMALSGVSGPPPDQTDFVASINPSRRKESTKIQPLQAARRCSYCCGPIDVGHEYRVTHQKKYYHVLCFEYVLNPEDQRRKVPLLPVK
jgi:hypothetical protein